MDDSRPSLCARHCHCFETKRRRNPHTDLHIHICCTVVTRTTTMEMKLCTVLFCLPVFGTAHVTVPQELSALSIIHPLLRKGVGGTTTNHFVRESVWVAKSPLYHIWLSLSDDCRSLWRPATSPPPTILYGRLFSRTSPNMEKNFGNLHVSPSS